MPEPRTEVDFEELLEPFAEWEFLERDDKRSLLAALCPEIRVERYVVKSLMLNLVQHSGNDVSQNPVAAASPPARFSETRATQPRNDLPIDLPAREFLRRVKHETIGKAEIRL